MWFPSQILKKPMGKSPILKANTPCMSGMSIQQQEPRCLSAENTNNKQGGNAIAALRVLTCALVSVCVDQRGATVLLYHPCAPLQERLLLSVLARSCLSHYVVTSHPHLEEHMVRPASSLSPPSAQPNARCTVNADGLLCAQPIALVSWGRTLELSTAASSDICGWLETTASGRRRPVDEGQSRGYDLLLTRSAERRRANPEGSSANVTVWMFICVVRGG